MRVLFGSFLLIFLFFARGIFSSELIQETLRFPEVAGYYIPKELLSYVIDTFETRHDTLLHSPANILSVRLISTDWNASLLTSKRFQALFERAIIYAIKYQNQESRVFGDFFKKKYQNLYSKFLFPFSGERRLKTPMHSMPGFEISRFITSSPLSYKWRQKGLLCVVNAFSMLTTINLFCEQVYSILSHCKYKKQLPIKLIFQQWCRLESIMAIYEKFIDNQVFPRVVVLPILLFNQAQPAEIIKKSIERLFCALCSHDQLQYIFCVYDNAPLFLLYIAEKYQKYVRYYSTNHPTLAKTTLLNPNLQWTMEDIKSIAQEAAKNGDSDLFLKTFLYCVEKGKILDLDFSRDIIGMFMKQGIIIRPILSDKNHLVTQCYFYPELVRQLLYYGAKIDQEMVNETPFTLLEFVLEKLVNHRAIFESLLAKFFDAISTINLLLEYNAPYKKGRVINLARRLFLRYQDWLGKKRGYNYKKNISLQGLSLQNKMLFTIVQQGHVFLLPLILLSGADLNTRNKFGRTVGYYVKNSSVLDYLLRYNLIMGKTDRKKFLSFIKNKKNIRSTDKDQLIQYIANLAEH